MDATLLAMMRSNGRNKEWVETMVNLEARKLVNRANQLASFHFRDGFTRIKFVKEIQTVIEQQFTTARNAKNDEECIACITALRAETNNLEEQDRMLRMNLARLYAMVEFVRKDNKIIGYMISGVYIVASGLTAVGGLMMIATMGALGTLAGATLVIDGINGITKELINLTAYGESSPSEGLFAEATMALAEFMGFTSDSGLATYNGLTLGASLCNMVGAIIKPAAWRLFKWMPSDYYRKIETMSRPSLTMQIAGDGIKAKVVFDYLVTDKIND